MVEIVLKIVKMNPQLAHTPFRLSLLKMSNQSNFCGIFSRLALQGSKHIFLTKHEI